MKTIRRLIYGEVLRACGFVTLAFLALFFFFDLVDALSSVGKVAAQTGRDAGGGATALLLSALQVPAHLYELLPITVLIGTIYVMARLAESSEFTILRTSGLGPAQALRTLLLLGAGFVALTFVFGDYVAPMANRATQAVRAQYLGDTSTGRTGAWLKDRQGGRDYWVNVASLAANGQMGGVRITEQDSASGRITATMQAEAARFEADGWLLQNVRRQHFPPAAAQADAAGTEAAANADAPPHPNTHAPAHPHTQGHAAAPAPRPAVGISHDASWLWPTAIRADMVAAAVLSPDRMQTVELFLYIRHLQGNGQSAQRYEIEFWRKVFYPLSCLVMMVLALPFAYLHFRSGNITGYVFLGVLVGISFFLLNNVFGHIGEMRNWLPWLAAAAPGVLYSIASLAAFGWLVLRK